MGRLNTFPIVMYWSYLVLKINYVNTKMLLIFLLELYYTQRFNERNIELTKSLDTVCYEIIRYCLPVEY